LSSPSPGRAEDGSDHGNYNGRIQSEKRIDAGNQRIGHRLRQRYGGNGGAGQRQDNTDGLPGSGDHRTDELPLAQGRRGLQVDQARRLKELEQENAKLKRPAAGLSLDKLVLKDIASGNFQ